jgi:hypothetical protein
VSAVQRLDQQFGVVLPGLPHHDVAAGVADRMVAALADPFHLGEIQVVVGASIGIAFAQTGSTAPVATLPSRSPGRRTPPCTARRPGRSVAGYLSVDFPVDDGMEVSSWLG